MNRAKYDSVEQVEAGIYKVTKDKVVKYVAVCDYGRQPKLDRKTGQMLMKQKKTELTFDTLKMARQAKATAVHVRKIGMNTSSISSTKFCDVVEDFKKCQRYNVLDDSYKDHFNNYINHLVDFFGDMDVNEISIIDMENYYAYQMNRGNLASAKKNKDGTISKKEGISINTISKHKTGAKKIWDFMIDAKVYGVTLNVAEKSSVPKVDVMIDGKSKKMSKVPYHARSLTLEELNYTLNDAVQHEFDRSIAVMIGLAAIGTLRHSEVVGLQIGKVRHDDYMNISEDVWEYSGYDKEFYRAHDEFIMIDTAIMTNRVKLPKDGTVRIVAKPVPLHEILEYAMEQRMEVLDIVGRKLESTEQVYLPLVNILRNQPLNSQKLGRKWTEYQNRRNKRMVADGLTPIPVVRFHDLRHTFSNLTKAITYEWERSYNMGHRVKGDNTTNRTYVNDRIVDRDNIFKFFNENIKIDWDKAMRKKLNDEGSRAFVNASGHLVVTDKATEERKQQGKKFIFKEEEIVALLGE